MLREVFAKFFRVALCSEFLVTAVLERGAAEGFFDASCFGMAVDFLSFAGEVAVFEDFEAVSNALLEFSMVIERDELTLRGRYRQEVLA